MAPRVEERRAGVAPVRPARVLEQRAALLLRRRRLGHRLALAARWRPPACPLRRHEARDLDAEVAFARAGGRVPR
eukprot:6116830-Prymnesium_polylepis.1